MWPVPLFSVAPYLSLVQFSVSGPGTLDGCRVQGLLVFWFRGGVNDTPRGEDSFSDLFVIACARFVSLLSSLHPRFLVVVSSVGRACSLT